MKLGALVLTGDFNKAVEREVPSGDLGERLISPRRAHLSRLVAGSSVHPWAYCLLAWLSGPFEVAFVDSVVTFVYSFHSLPYSVPFLQGPL